jgi:hypothetical protein
MRALAIIGCTVGGAGVGFVVGIFWPTKGADDFGFGAAMNGVCGAFLGGVAGVVAGAVLFA